jgi:hypothetical protein
MQNYSLLSKGLAVGIILLFVGVALIPSINYNSVNATPEDDMVKFTIEAYGIPGLKPQTVILTKHQANKVEDVLNQIKRDLDNTTTKEETLAIFDHAVVDLDEFGLLDSMSVEEVQRLVKRGYPNLQTMNLYKDRYCENQILNDSNFFCLIAGEAKETRLLSLFETGCSTLCYFLFGMFLFTHILGDDPVVLYNIVTRIQTLSDSYHTLNSVRIIGTGEIAFGSSHVSDQLPPPYRFDPAVGWITTQGVLGKKSWNGSFFGGIFGLVTFDPNFYAYYLGATGFLGIKVKKSDGKLFFLGSALRVKINQETV